MLSVKSIITVMNTERTGYGYETESFEAELTTLHLSRYTSNFAFQQKNGINQVYFKNPEFRVAHSHQSIPQFFIKEKTVPTYC